MYIIIVYDVAPKREPKLLKLLRQHLIWVQNSVFEGEMTPAGYEILREEIIDIVNLRKDSIIIYTFESRSYSSRKIIGIEKNKTDSFI
ncbi:MAG: CRISPR-associated endonuclease Cas2 [Bacillota bacterium]